MTPQEHADAIATSVRDAGFCVFHWRPDGIASIKRPVKNNKDLK